ncbi:MAG: hypothetical protein QXX17_03915 [Conexivisphaerales archaeon]
MLAGLSGRKLFNGRQQLFKLLSSIRYVSVREENYNVLLAELLAERGLKALGEAIIKEGKGRAEPDVTLELNGVKILIEGKKPGQWEALRQKCEERLRSGLCDICIMVEYVDVPLGQLYPTQLQIKEGLLKGKYNIGILSYLDVSNLDWLLNLPSKPEKYEGVGFGELLTYVRNAYSNVVQTNIIDKVVEEMKGTLDGFASDLYGSIDIERLKDALEIREKEEGEDEQ